MQKPPKKKEYVYCSEANQLEKAYKREADSFFVQVDHISLKKGFYLVKVNWFKHGLSKT